MEHGNFCLCDPVDPADPTECLEILRNKYLISAAKLREQEMEMERKMAEMEAFIGPRALYKEYSCHCDADAVSRMTGVLQSQQHVIHQCSFFQRMTENARNILAMKCQCPNAFMAGVNTSSFTPAAGIATSGTTSSETLNTHNGRFTEDNILDYDSSLSDQSSRTSICTCGFTDSSTLQDFSCTCSIIHVNSKQIPGIQQMFASPSPSMLKSLQEKGDKCNVAIQTVAPDQSKSGQIGQETPCSSVTCCCNSGCLIKSKKGLFQLPDKIILDIQAKENAFQEQLQLACQAKWRQNNPANKDKQNQCAFIGSPFLEVNNLPPYGKSSPICDCNTLQGGKKNSSYTPEMRNNGKPTEEEKCTTILTEHFHKPEKQYQQVSKNAETLAKTACCGCCQESNTNVPIDLERISRELRIENQMLKSEFEDMKLELKHCLEKMEGSRSYWLQAEKKETNELKLQLCYAYTNIIELNQKNQGLRDELVQLNYLCQALETDLISQNFNEAKPIKRLISGKNSAENKEKYEDFQCHSNLEMIARKLSKTLKDLNSCEECSQLPAELVGAARSIKELTDMVRKRRTRGSSSNGCNCQKRPSKERSNVSSQSPKYSSPAGESTTKQKDKTVKIILDASKTFIQNDENSKFDVPGAELNFCSATNQPPVAKFGISRFQSREMISGIRDVLLNGPGPEENLSSHESSRRAEPSSDQEFPKALMKRISFEERSGESDFPYEEENKINLEQPPVERHMTTTIALSGILEVLTEGPEGTIGTILTYTEDGNIEVTTEITNLGDGELPR